VRSPSRQSIPTVIRQGVRSPAIAGSGTLQSVGRETHPLANEDRLHTGPPCGPFSWSVPLKRHSGPRGALFAVSPKGLIPRANTNFHVLSKRKKQAHQALDREPVQLVVLQSGNFRLADFEALRRTHLSEPPVLDQPIDLRSETHLRVECGCVRQTEVREGVPGTRLNMDGSSCSFCHSGTMATRVARHSKCKSLHEKLGFERVAMFRQVGFKHDRWVDVAYWQIVL